MSEKSPAVSVVVPTYNRAHLLGRSIRSVLNQTYQDFEIIVIDDASTDNTEELIMSLGNEQIRYIRHEKNKGAAAARNTGIKAARGSFIAFQDSDDEWLPEKLEKQMKVFKTSQEEVGMVYSDMWRQHGTKKRYFHAPSINPEDGIVYERALNYLLANIGVQSALIRKKCFAKAGLFDEEFKRYIDLEFFIRLSKYFYFYHIKEPLVIYFYTDNSLSFSIENDITARKFILEKYFIDIKKNNNILARHYLAIGYSLNLSGDFINSREYFIKAVKAYPFSPRLLLNAILSFLGKEIYNAVLKNYRNWRRLRDAP